MPEELVILNSSIGNSEKKKKTSMVNLHRVKPGLDITVGNEAVLRFSNL